MLITNQTSQDYWFGPLHLPAGAGTGTLTVDDTTATSLYLSDDGIADAINTLYSSGKVTVSSPAPPFPRPTGTPGVLHGDGSPEGLVYAGQGTLYLCRSGASVFQKSTGVHLSTGWTQLAQGQKTTVSAMSAGPPSTPVTGDIWFATGVDTNGAVWTFCYNGASASTYKWEFIGGSEMFSEVVTAETTASTTYVDLATVGPNITVPRGGDYDLAWGANLGVVGQAGWVTPKYAAAAAADADGEGAEASTASPSAIITRSPRKTGMAAGDVIKIQYRMIAGTGTFSRRWLRVKPVRII